MKLNLNNIIRAGGGSVFIKVLNSFLSFSLSVFLANNMGASDYGKYSYALAVVMLISIPAQLGIPQIIVRETAKYKVKNKISHINGLWLWGLSLVLIFSFIFFVITAVFSIYAVEEDSYLYIYLSLLIPIMGGASVWSACLRGLGKVFVSLISENIIKPFLFIFLVLSVILVKGGGDLSPINVIYINVSSSFFALVFSFFLLRIYGNLKEIKRDGTTILYKYWFRSVLPFCLISGMYVLNTYADIVILGFFESDESVGVYRAVSQLSMLIAFGLGAINQILHPNFSRLYSENNLLGLRKLVLSSSRVILILSIIPFIFFLCFGEDVIFYLFGESYRYGYPILLILSFGQLLNSAFGSVGALLSMTGHEKDTAKGLMISIVINISLNFILIPILEMQGAAIATLISLIVWNVILRYYVKKRLGIESSALFFKK